MGAEASMKEFWFESKGTRLFAVEGGEGPVIVMLHGGMADHRAAMPTVSGLAERFRVVLPDQRGSGRSIYGEDLSFDQLADDIAALLDHLNVEQAVIAGMSGGTGPAAAFALKYPGWLKGLVLVTPMYAGSEMGYTEFQEQAFAMMDALARRAPDEGVGVLRPLYANLPEPIRDKALAMLEEFEGASVAATSRFIASGVQPFDAPMDLAAIPVPVLLVRGDDPMHPGEVSDLYADHLRHVQVLPSTTTDIPSAIATFCADLK